MLEFSVMGVVSALLLGGLTWMGSVGRYRLTAAILIALFVSVPSAYLAYGAFRA